MIDNAKSIMFKLQNCDTIQELAFCWKEYKRFVQGDPDKDLLIQLKEVMKEYLSNKEKEVYQSAFTQEDCRKIENELSLSLPEKKRKNALRIKRLKYFEIL